MAIVGFEVDQVFLAPDGGGEEISVPINVAYNHHFESTMVGKGANLKKAGFPVVTVLTRQPVPKLCTGPKIVCRSQNSDHDIRDHFQFTHVPLFDRF